MPSQHNATEMADDQQQQGDVTPHQQQTGTTFVADQQTQSGAEQGQQGVQLPLFRDFASI